MKVVLLPGRACISFDVSMFLPLSVCVKSSEVLVSLVS